MKKKKKRKKEKKISQSIFKNKSFLYTTSFLLLLLTVVFSTTFFRRKELEKNKQYTVCKVYDIKTRIKGSNSVDYSTYVYFFVNNKKNKASFRKKPYKNIEIGMCFELIYSKKNYKNNKINFDKRLNCSPHLAI